MTNFKREIAAFLAPATGLAESTIEEAITLPQHSAHGDFAFPCFPLAKTLRKAPPAIALDLAQRLQPPSGFVKIEAAGGYLNFFVDKTLFAQKVLEAVLQEADYGSNTRGAGKPVVLDFSSPNMGKELAFHHLRGTMLGNSLSRIFAKSGFAVTRINHLGDWGTSYGKLIVMYLRAGLAESDLPTITLERLNGLYRDFEAASRQDPSLEDQARATFVKLESGDPATRKLWSAFREVTLLELRRLYQILGVEFDSYDGEAFFSDRMGPVLESLQALRLLKSSEGAEVVDLSTFDLPPALIRKTDGSTLYITRDLAAALYRRERYAFEHCLYVVDNGQSLHFRQLFTVLDLMGPGKSAGCEHVPFGLVLIKGEEGGWEKGKTRSGGASLLKDVLEAAQDKILAIMAEKNPEVAGRKDLALQIAVGALVFSEMKNRRLNDIRFDWDQALSFDGDSGPYVQNAHVRLCSILRKAGEEPGKPDRESHGLRWEVLTEPAAFALIDLLAQFPEKVIAAMESRDACPLAQYALSLADASHSFLHSNRILGSAEQRERLFLARAVKSVLASTLNLTGIPAIEVM